MVDVFISYKREDEAQAQQLYNVLTESGYQVWMDIHNIPPGSYWPDEIDKGLQATSITVGMISPEALKSRNVRNEWDYTLEVEKPLLLLKVKEFPRETMPHRYVSINYIDMLRTTEQALSTLLDTVRSFVRHQSPPVPRKAPPPNVPVDDSTTAETKKMKPITPEEIEAAETELREILEAVEQFEVMSPPDTNQPADVPTQPAENIPPTPTPPAQPINRQASSSIPVREELNARTIKDRQQLIERVFNFWIDGYLKQSLRFGEISVELEENRHYVLHHSEYGDYNFKGSSKLVDIFRDVNGQLLILGEPGSGKTTLLLQLAKDLLETAKVHHSAPVPVMLSLTAWSNTWKNPEEVDKVSLKNRKKMAQWLKNELTMERTHLSITDWMIAELVGEYEIQDASVESWLKHGRIICLFDGLDEVSAEHRAECVEALNIFKDTYPNVDIVVCSRIEEYKELSSKLDFSTGLMVQSISDEQIQQYLQANATSQLMDLYNQGDAIADLVRTPFWLSFSTYVYRNFPSTTPTVTTDNAMRAIDVFQTYTNGILQSMSPAEREALLKGAGRLALQMSKLGASVVYPNRINFKWLNTREALVVTGAASAGAVLTSLSAVLFASPLLRVDSLVSRTSKFFMKRVSNFDIDDLLPVMAAIGMMYKSGDGYIFFHLSFRDYLSQNYAEEKDTPIINSPNISRDVKEMGGKFTRNLMNRFGKKSDDSKS